jgi:NADH-quinone oxidoreductase subunit M
VYSVFFMILTLAAIGLPTTSGFTGDFLVLLGAFHAAWPQFEQGVSYPLVLASLAVLGIVLGALYMLRLARRLLFGEARAPVAGLRDLSLREAGILGVLVVAVFYIGLFPNDFLQKTEQAAMEYQERILAARGGEGER